MTVRLLVALSLVVVSICHASAQVPPLLVPEPGPTNVVLPILQRPFNGNFTVGNFFDHNLPKQFVDANGVQVVYWGDQTLFLDGHQGYDFPMPIGTPLLAAVSGQVTFAGLTSPFFCPTLNQTVSNINVSIRHQTNTGETVDVIYVHLSQVSVQVGDVVKPGQQVGLSGNTGCSTEPHLHFEIWRRTNTNNGQPTAIDPYGWEGPGPDPWAKHPDGAQSVWLWKPGEAPSLFRDVTLPPNPAQSDAAPVAITNLRWMGWKDVDHPNNEYVELTLDTRFVPSGVFNLTGWQLRNNRQKAFRFPSGFQIKAGAPVRIYSGVGVNSQTVLFWGLSHGIWDDLGDCAHLVHANGFDWYVLRSQPSCTYVPPVINCPSSSLQLAIDNALPGETVLVSGQCNENIIVRNEKQRFTLDGAGAGIGTKTTISGASGSPTINVRGKGILLQNLNITGGKHGVHVNRGSNAVLDNNTIQNSAGSGVLVDELSIAVLTNNTIQNHPGAGILVSEASTARVGFNSDSDLIANANTIQSSGIGMLVSNGSSARIIGNTIQNNMSSGVQVVRDSYADIASNVISGNATNGIEVGDNSMIQLGEDAGTSIFAEPNSSSTVNAGFGIRCLDGGAIDGQRGGLSGSSGAESISATCVSSLSP